MKRIQCAILFACLSLTEVASANLLDQESSATDQPSVAAVASHVTASELSQAISYRALGITTNGFKFRLGQKGYFTNEKNSKLDGPSSWLVAANKPIPLPQPAFDWSRVSLWATPVISKVDNRIKPLTSKGMVKVLMVGAEYASEDELQISGLVFSRDWLDIDTTYNEGVITGAGLTIAPYIVLMLSDEWSFDASLGLGQSETTSRAADLLSKPKLDRRFVTLGLTRAQSHGKWLVMYKAALSNSKDRVKPFTYSNGQNGLTSTTQLNQFKVGVHAIFNNAPLSPFISAYNISNDLSITDSSELKPREYANTQQVQLGLNASSGAFYGSLAYQIERGRSQWRLYGGIRF